MSETTKSHATVIIADDHDLMRVGVRELLVKVDGIDIVAEATNGIEAVSSVKQHQPDLLIVDIAMPYANGIEVIEEVKRWSPATRCIVLTGMTAVALLQQAVQAGAAGIFLKSDETEELVTAIPAILKGASAHAPRVTAALEQHSRFSALSPRELEVLQGLVRGESLRDLAARLCISRNTADKHRSAIMRKLSVHSAAEMIALAYREGLFEASRQL